jgi:hypothetical protein
MYLECSTAKTGPDKARQAARAYAVEVGYENDESE